MNTFLLDPGLAPHAAAMLREQGLDVLHVSEIGMERAEDVQIYWTGASFGGVTARTRA